MNKSGLYIMFALVVVVGLAVLLRDENQQPLGPGDDPLRAVDWSSVARVTCRRDDGVEWSFERDKGRWFLSSTTIAEGRRVAANDVIRLHAFDALRDTVPLQSLPSREIDVEAVGLSPAALRVEIEDSSGSHTIEFGKVDANHEVYYRRAGSSVAFKCDELVASELRREPVWLRSPRLTEIDLERAQRIEVSGAGRPAWALERSGLRILIERPDRRTVRADFTLAEQVMNGLCRFSGIPIPNDEAGIDEDQQPVVSVVVRDVDGHEQAFDVYKIDDDDRSMIARRRDELEFRRIEGEYRRFLTYEPSELEDAVVAAFELRDLESVEIHSDGSEFPYSLVRRGNNWQLRIGKAFYWMIDVEGFQRLRDSLFGMRALERLDARPPFEPAGSVTYSMADTTGAPPIRLEFSERQPDGSVLVTRSDEAGAARVDGRMLEVIATPYWRLLGRYVTSGSDVGIDRISITDQDGVTYRIERSPQNPELWLLVDREGNGASIGDARNKEVPSDFLTGLLTLLSWWQVKEFEGPESAAAVEAFETRVAEAFKSPRYRVSWTHREPPRPQDQAWGPWVPEVKTLEVGTRLDDVDWLCRINSFPNLCFRVSGEQFVKIEDALRPLRD